jgi:hypothetical protein
MYSPHTLQIQSYDARTFLNRSLSDDDDDDDRAVLHQHTFTAMDSNL